MRLYGDFTIRTQEKRALHGGEQPCQLFRFQDRGSSTAKVERGELAAFEGWFSRIQGNFGFERTAKGFCSRLTVHLQVKSAVITPLPAKRDMEVQAKSRRHDFSENGTGLEKSFATTISISSVGAMPRFRTWDDQAGCCLSDSKTCFKTCGLI